MSTSPTSPTSPSGGPAPRLAADGDRDLSSRAVVRLVVVREFRTRVLTKAFAITTALLLISLAGFAVVSKIAGGGDDPVTVAVTAPLAGQAAQVRAAARSVGIEARTTRVADLAAGQAALREGRADAVVSGSPGALRLTFQKDVDDDLRNAVQLLARQQALDAQLRSAGADPAQVSQAVGAAGVSVHSLEAPVKNRNERIALAFVAGILVYLALMVYGQTVAAGVVEEKSSRVVELLLSTVRPWQLMLGKVVGIGLAGLVQLALTAVVGVVAALSLDVLDVPSSIAVSVALWGVVWFLLGFFVFALLFAAAGALVSRQEDIGGVTSPLLTLIVVPYVLGISVLPGDPDNPLIHWLSLVPLLSPTLMPMRVAIGDVPAWELGLSVVLTLALFAALVSLTGRIYRNSVLRTGARVSIKDALRAA